MPRVPAKVGTLRPRPGRDANRCTRRFWANLGERVRTYLVAMHGDDNAQGGGWVRRSSRHDVERAAILARRDVMADTTVRKPPNFLRGAHDAPTRMTLRRIHRDLVRFGFNAHVAGRIAPSATAGRLASMSTLDFASPPRDHGRRTWWKAFTPLYGERLYILDVGCGRKSWTRWLTECVPEPWIGRFSIVTVDWDARMDPDILGDIMRWRTWLQCELAALGYEHVTRWHIVHFAAECTEYSPLKNGRDAERDLTCATWLASCGMELIIQMHPIIWMIECSGAGAHALKTQPIMQDARMSALLVNLTLCNFGAQIRKESSWWTNIPRTSLSTYGFPVRPCCDARGCKCLWAMLFGKHIRHVGGRRGGDTEVLGANREESMQYPNALCAMWITSALHAMLSYEFID